MPSAPASTAFSAAFAVMMPFIRNGFFVQDFRNFRSSTVFEPGASPLNLQWLSPALSTTTQVASVPLDSKRSIFSQICAFGRGLNTGIAQSGCSATASSAPATVFSTMPSPKQSTIPVSAQARIIAALNPTVTSSLLYWVMEPMGPVRIGRLKRCPNRSIWVSTAVSGAKVSTFRRIAFQPFQFSCAPFPGALDPGPGRVFPQPSPLHSGHTLQLRMVFLAFSRTS